MSTNDFRAKLASWVDSRIEEMLAAPRMWGKCLETVELQILTLLQVRALVTDMERELAHPRRVLDEYVRLLGTRFKDQPPRPVHQIVGETSDEQFVSLIRDLNAALRDPLPAEDEEEFFSRTYLGIDLRFVPGAFLSTQAVTSFYEDFRRATRSLARVGTGRTGRVEKSIEMATDFVLESMEITPLNGVPARARLALGTPYGQLELSGGRVHDALSQILDAAARADAQGSDAVLAFGAELDVETRTRALVQTMRVLPHGIVDEITIGGTCVARAPVKLRKIHEPKLMAAVGKNLEPSQYDETALIRAIDLDRGSISHGNAPRNRVSCYISSEHFSEITQVGVLARIVGKRFDPPSGQPFVIAERIDVLADRANPRVKTVEVHR